jgi:hypothetical protein
VPIDSTNISFARVVYAILKVLYKIRRDYAKYIKSKYVSNSYINYDAKILREYLNSPSGSNNSLLTDSKIGVYVINQEVVKMDVSTSIAADLSRITFKPAVVIADNGDTYEIVISDISHSLVQKVIESMIHVAPALQKLPILNVILSHNQLRITTPKTSIEGIHTLISQLDKAIKGAVLEVEHPYQRIIPSNKRIAYAPIRDESQLDSIRNTLKDLAQIQNEDNSFFFKIDKSILRFSIYRDDSTGRIMSNCKIFAPKKLAATHFIDIIQSQAKATLNSSMIPNFESKLVINGVIKNSAKTLAKLSLSSAQEKDDFELLMNELGAVDTISEFLEKMGDRENKSGHVLKNFFWTISGEIADVLATAIIHSPEYDKIQKRFKTLYPNGVDANGNKVSIYPIITVARVIVNLYSENSQSSLKMIVRDIINTGSFMNVRPLVSKQNLPIFFIASF